MTGNPAPRLAELIAACSDPKGPYLIHGNDLNVADRQALQTQLAQLGFYIGTIDGKAAADEMALIAAIDQAFQFPGYFGKNWNAVDECLADLSWLSATGYLCLLLSNVELAKSNQRVYPLFLDVFQTAAASWQDNSIPFKLLLA